MLKKHLKNFRPILNTGVGTSFIWKYYISFKNETLHLTISVYFRTKVQIIIRRMHFHPVCPKMKSSLTHDNLIDSCLGGDIFKVGCIYVLD